MTDRTALAGSYLFHEFPGRPDNVHLCTTLISGGFSKGDFESFNLASHVGDSDSAVSANRRKLVDDLGLSSEPVWLDQVHSRGVLSIDSSLGRDIQSSALDPVPKADASICHSKGVTCAVLTADCLPVFICDASGREIAVAHAGWRGLHAGILSNTIDTMSSSKHDLYFFFGPAIGPLAFEVGEDVRLAFIEKDPAYSAAFESTVDERYLCDIYTLARTELIAKGIDPGRVYGGSFCTFKEASHFYSYRKRQNTGRMASLIWMV